MTQLFYATERNVKTNNTKEIISNEDNFRLKLNTLMASSGMPTTTAATFKWQQAPTIAVWLQQIA